MIYRVLVPSLTIVAVVAAGALSVQKNRISYSCTGEYSADVIYSGTRVTSQISIMSSSARSQKLYVSYDGAVKFNNKSYHLNRELIFHYEMLDKKAGLLRITPISQSKNTSDTLDSREVESLLLGVEKEGRLIRILRIGERMVLVGNPYAPIYSCVLLGS